MGSIGNTGDYIITIAPESFDTCLSQSSHIADLCLRGLTGRMMNTEEVGGQGNPVTPLITDSSVL